MDAELIYNALRELAESHGFVTDQADDLLAEAARSMADYEIEIANIGYLHQ